MTVNEELTYEDQIDKIAALLPQGYRLVTMTAVDCGDHFDIYYHFDRNYELYTLRLQAEKGKDIPSITPVCFAALTVENEIQDLFGITFTGLELDYLHHFILSHDAPEKPFCRVPGVSVSTIEATKTAGGAQ